MSYKIKSVLYFASLVLALIAYYHIDDVDSTQNNDLEKNIVNASAIKELK